MDRRTFGQTTAALAAGATLPPLAEADGLASPRAIGWRLAASREARGLSVAEAAAAIGATPDAWQSMEAGLGEPDGERLTLAAVLLGADPCWLGFGKGPAPR